MPNAQINCYRLLRSYHLHFDAPVEASPAPLNIIAKRETHKLRHEMNRPPHTSGTSFEELIPSQCFLPSRCEIFLLATKYQLTATDVHVFIAWASKECTAQVQLQNDDVFISIFIHCALVENMRPFTNIEIETWMQCICAERIQRNTICLPCVRFGRLYFGESSGTTSALRK